ncbi:hypothetical protein BN946_scf184789.g3 [Trametes cinnabarina]|uniref:Fungal-type protein kinase domain-containing protein n=1 Tax=Pycnoporus cinnabarinus TaxID=5643 RepID=A0A060SUN2_PYCCI|nr:hypothetical protein BN946_scf184789.g3 [Trametes cinnabarina]
MSSTDAQPTTTDAPPQANASLSRPGRRIREVRARALTDFENPRELVSVMMDAIYAHKQLYEDAKILHGDINPNTIVIFEEPDSEPEGVSGSGSGQGNPRGRARVRARGGLVDFDPPLEMKGKGRAK